MKDNYTHIKAIVDRSGSMATCKDDMINGLNEFFKGQAELEGTCLVDYSQFDTVYEEVFADTISYAAKAVLEPRGLTALNDAIGKGATDLGAKLAKMKEEDRPSKVIVVVVTDGGENASQEWSVESVKALVKQQTDKYNWEFVFLGANIDAIATSGSYGFSSGNTLQYDTTNVGAMSASLNSKVTRTRSGLSSDFTEEERRANA